MAGRPHLSARRSGNGATCSAPGLRRVAFVLIIVDEHRTSCQVAGIGHRHPVRRNVPLGTAVALIAGGTPYFVHRAAAGPPAAVARRHVSDRSERV